MKIYFVRHGQTESNVNRLYQGKDEPLSAKGKEQAEFMADRFKTIPLDAIISSPSPRAQDTAQAISGIRGLTVETLEALKERVWPQEFIGKPKSDPELIKIRRMLDEKDRTDPQWHYSTEENFIDVRNRCLAARAHLESLAQTHTSIAVVTHVRFLKLFLCTVIYGDAVSADIFYPFFENISITNTGLTVCEYLPEAKRPWHVIAINDHAHLGEHQRQLLG